MTIQLQHDAFLYESVDEYVQTVHRFVLGAIDADEAVLVSVPGPKLELLRHVIDGGVGRVEFADMTEVGRNPARIIPVISAFVAAHPGRPVRFVGEPIWAGRTQAEIVESTRHEALLNTAFAGADASILCPYDARALDAEVISDAKRTHPTLMRGGKRRKSDGYKDPRLVYDAANHPFPDPNVPAETLILMTDQGLRSLRRFVEEHLRHAGMEARRTADFLLAAHEAGANTLLHAGSRGIVRLWSDGTEVVCEIADRGLIDDPLVGRRAPDPRSERGRGLWLINHLCDLVELRSQPGSTVIRLHMNLG
jgi:anti-sigma regulatory factor (Ser/Thr protein kinase)